LTTRIALTGTHSTGKTTLLKRLQMELRAHGLTVARTRGSIAQLAADRGFPKMREQTAATTEWIMAMGIAAELEATLHADIVLVDRSVIDPLAYWIAAHEYRDQTPDPDEVQHLTDIARAHARGYTLVLGTVLDPHMPLGDHRDCDLRYRAMVGDTITRLLPLVETPALHVFNSGTSREAATQAVLAAASQPAPA
jgi:hypothetical protein